MWGSEATRIIVSSSAAGPLAELVRAAHAAGCLDPNPARKTKVKKAKGHPTHRMVKHFILYVRGFNRPSSLYI